MDPRQARIRDIQAQRNLRHVEAEDLNTTLLDGLEDFHGFFFCSFLVLIAYIVVRTLYSWINLQKNVFRQYTIDLPGLCHILPPMRRCPGRTRTGAGTQGPDPG